MNIPIFIKLTGGNGGNTIRINCLKVEYFQKDSGYTGMTIGGDTLMVKETPEEIEALIEAACRDAGSGGRIFHGFDN